MVNIICSSLCVLSADIQQGFQKEYPSRAKVCANIFVQIRDASEDLTPGLQSIGLPEQFLGAARDNAERKICAPDRTT